LVIKDVFIVKKKEKRYMIKLVFIICLSFLFSCGVGKPKTINHCKKSQIEAYKAQKKMARARRRASR
jgi:hypothetical protein